MEASKSFPQKLHFDSIDDYANTFRNILSLEESTAKEEITQLKREGLNLVWGHISNANGVIAHIDVKDVDSKRYKFPLILNVFHEDILDKDSTQIRLTGNIKNCSDPNKIEIFFRYQPGIRKAMTKHANWTIEPIYANCTISRQMSILDELGDNTKFDKDILKIVLGEITVKNVTEKKPFLKQSCFPSFNESQEKALLNAFQKNFTIIQGPPGTGKTTLIAALATLFAQDPQNRILCTAGSNLAVSRIALLLNEWGLRVVHVVPSPKECDTFPTDHIRVDLRAKQRCRTLRILRKRKRQGELDAEEKKQYKAMKIDLYETIIKEAQIVCTTCNGAGTSYLRNQKFTQVVIDEATQVLETDTLLALGHGCKQAILIGDHMQLGPTVISKEAFLEGLGISLMDRLILSKFPYEMINVQYRMHPDIALFPCNHFYQGNLRNGVLKAQRTPKTQVYDWPNKEIPIVFYDCASGLEMQANGTKSFENEAEATKVFEIAQYLVDHGVDEEDIGIISPYSNQCFSIMKKLENACIERIRIASVDGFQGGEKDYIIMSCVRANEREDLGFVADERRLNVSLTRARFGLFIVGNERLLRTNTHWKALIEHLHSIGVAVKVGGYSLMRKSQQWGKDNEEKIKEFYDILNAYKACLERNFRDSGRYNSKGSFRKAKRFFG